MKQVTAEKGKASGHNMQSIIKAVTVGKDWEGKIPTNNAWKRAHADYPEHFVPSQAKDHEDRWAEWLTTQNINDWIDSNKKYIIDIDFVKNESGFICKLSMLISLSFLLLSFQNILFIMTKCFSLLQ